MDSPQPGYRLDHVCLAVRKLAPARALLEKMLGYTARTQPVENTRQQVLVQFMRKPGSIDEDASIAFAFLGAGLNVELIDTDARRAEHTR